MIVSILTMSFSTKGYQEVTLSSGTIIPLENANEINSATLTAGQTLDFFVRQDIKVEGQTVVKRGALARGQVLRVQRAKGLGKEGFVEVEIRSVEAVDGSEILLTGGRLTEEGDDRQVAAIALGVLVCILFLTMKGKNAVIPKGYAVDARVANDIQIAVQ
ncbi:hypothetical protein [Litoribacter populi]|uniref:hypothetical protein n=1 Tax=Litoribacter populi TaxID=2598460 RepID=UPI00163D9918|nr:hypothetical protein [Litoribacter populi]